MKPPLDPPAPHVRAQMRAAKRTSTGPEVLLRKALWAAGLRYRVDYAPPIGVRTRADIAFLGPRVLVYVDGCFWHGCPEHFVPPKNNAEFWRAKIARNQERDAALTASLTAAGWAVVRVWQHDIRAAGMEAIIAAIRARRPEPDLRAPRSAKV